MQRSLCRGTTALLVALSLALLAGCATRRSDAGADDVLLIRGELMHRARVALPHDSVAIVELTRPQDGRVLAEQRIALEGRQVPIGFELRVRRTALRDGAGYALRGAIHAHGRPAWLSDPVEVRAARGPLAVGSLLLRPYEAVAFASSLQCGARSAQIGTVRRGTTDVTRLSADGERYELRSVVSASGVRYEAVDDPTTQLWLKGDRATLTLRGELLPECMVTAEAPDALRARGNEPFWQLELGTALRFTADSLRFDGTAPPAQVSGDTRRHNGRVAGRTVNVEVVRRVCRDSMSGMPHPYAVEVIVDGRAFRGCGGEPEALLLGDEWMVEDIGGGLIDRSRATLDFGIDGRLAGRATCNAYTTSYTVSGERLTIGTTATTTMSCPPPLMEQERRFLDILQRVRIFDITDNGALLLQDDQRRRIIARRPAGAPSQ